MAYILPLLSVVACPLVMGAMMWLMMDSQGTPQHDNTSVGITPHQPSRMRLCIDWKVVAALTWAAFVLWLMAPNFFWLALPLLIIAACPLSMLLMMRGMRRRAPLAHTKEVFPAAEAHLPPVRAQHESPGHETVPVETTQVVEREEQRFDIHRD
jgi:hypothetical protein